MNADNEDFRTLVIAWAVIVSIFLAVLLPYAINVPTLPALFYKTVTARTDRAAVPGVSFSQAASANPDGLLVMYDFEEDTGKNFGVTDRSGTGNHAVAKGLFIGSAPGVIGSRSVSLSGLGYLYTAQNPVGRRSNLSISLWFTAGDPGNNQRIAGAVSSEAPRSGWTVGTQSSELWDDDGNPVRVLSSTQSFGTLIFKEWNHKAVVYNGSTVQEYLNGILISEYQASGKPVGAGREMLIGSWQPFGRNYAGRVDDFRIYDRALSEDEVMELYREGTMG